MERTIDFYSAFYENDRKTPTGLVGYLRERGLTRVFLAGLAFDFCVRYSAEDAQREGLTVFVVEDACRGINVDGSSRPPAPASQPSAWPAFPRSPPPEALNRSSGMHLRQCSGPGVCNARKSLTLR